MKETSKLIMGASLVTVICLGAVLALLLVLLAELYCSLLLRKRRLQAAAAAATANAVTGEATTNNVASATGTASFQTQQDPPAPFSSVYAQGVLQAPRSLLFPNISSEKKESKLEGVHEIRIEEAKSSPNFAGTNCVGGVSSPSPSYIPVLTQPMEEVTVEGRKSGGGGEHLVYISNPIYDNEIGRVSIVDTPFETPDTSPSRLGMSGGSSSEDEKCVSPSAASRPSSLPMTPPLSPMKKLPEQACSVSLRDARSLDTSGSGSESVNGPSSSSSGSPRTSPSW